MSVASNMSKDSNAERDFEYGDGEFLTDPEISFTPSTPFEANPQRGMESQGFALEPKPQHLHNSNMTLTRGRIERSPIFTRRVRFVPTPISTMAILRSIETYAESTASRTMRLLAEWLATKLRTKPIIGPSTSLSL